VFAGASRKKSADPRRGRGDDEASRNRTEIETRGEDYHLRRARAKRQVISELGEPNRIEESPALTQGKKISVVPEIGKDDVGDNFA